MYRIAIHLKLLVQEFIKGLNESGSLEPIPIQVLQPTNDMSVRKNHSRNQSYHHCSGCLKFGVSSFGNQVIRNLLSLSSSL